MCPCGKEKEYLNCCGRFIEKNSLPLTPEELMRSRYSAYVKANIDYIQKTMQGKPLVNFDPIEAMKWAKSVTWKGLEVLQSEMDEVHGMVEFVATYEVGGKIFHLCEKSSFQKINEAWFYVGGIHIG